MKKEKRDVIYYEWKWKRTGQRSRSKRKMEKIFYGTKPVYNRCRVNRRKNRRNHMSRSEKGIIKDENRIIQCSFGLSCNRIIAAIGIGVRELRRIFRLRKSKKSFTIPLKR